MTNMNWIRRQVYWHMGVRVMHCPQDHRFATYLPRCPFCAPHERAQGVADWYARHGW